MGKMMKNCVNLAIKSMVMKGFFSLFLTIIYVSLCGCSGSGLSGVEADSVPPVAIERFDRAVGSFGTMPESGKDSVVSLYEPVIKVMGRIENVADADSLMSMLSASRATAVFQPDIESYLPDLSAAEASLGVLKDRMAASAVGFPSRVFGAVIPYDQSVIIADSIAIIGLIHYLGYDYPGYAGFDDYRRQLKVPSRIAGDLAEALVYTSLPYVSDAGATALSRMIYEGLVLAVVMEALPDLTLQSALAYDDGQMDWALQNEARIWEKMATDNMLYNSDPAVAMRLVAPSPSTNIVNPSSPGRIGRFVGYRIVEAYLSVNPEKSPDQLLSDRAYYNASFLVGSGYTGRGK